jgi:hypothetical protein
MGTSTEELSGDIARTRAELSYDVDALQDKVSPSAIMERRKSAMRGRLTSMKDKVMGSGSGLVGSGQNAVAGVGSTASSAGSAIESRVDGSPLAAGLVAFGAGLLVAGLVPASKAEAQGAQRLKEAAQEHGQPVMDEVKSAAQDVGTQLKQSASEAADQVRTSAQESAEKVKEEVPTGSSDASGESGDQTSYRATGPVV